MFTWAHPESSESANSVIWNQLPKTVFVGIKTLNFGVYVVSASFNDGNTVKCQTVKQLNIPLGKNTVQPMKIADRARVLFTEKQVQELQKNSKTSKKTKKKGYQKRSLTTLKIIQAMGGSVLKSCMNKLRFYLKKCVTLLYYFV